MLKAIKSMGVVRIVIALVVIALACTFIFRKQIQEHRVSRAKMEMMKRMTQSEPSEWAGEIRQVYDSVILEKVDTIGEVEH